MLRDGFKEKEKWGKEEMKGRYETKKKVCYWWLIKGEETRQRQAAETFNMIRRRFPTLTKVSQNQTQNFRDIGRIPPSTSSTASLDIILISYIMLKSLKKKGTQEGTEILYLLEKSSRVWTSTAFEQLFRMLKLFQRRLWNYFPDKPSFHARFFN